MKTVTVIIPTYNREKRIERTLTSVLNQDYRNIEIVIIDDGSTDATASVIKRLAEGNTNPAKYLRYYRQDNQGACVARNRGMMLATGTYIMFLDSDDLIKKTYLSAQVKEIESNKSQCSICDCKCIDEMGRIVGSIINNRDPHDFIRELVSPSISTVLMRRNSIPPGLQWNARLKRTQDIDFIYKYFASIEKYSYINQPLFQYCLHSGERISDSYHLKSVQYSILRKSFKSYTEENINFISADLAELYRSYTWVLRKHQLRNILIGFIPISIRKLRKKIISRKNSNTDHEKAH